MAWRLLSTSKRRDSTQVEVAQKENKVEQKLKQVEQFWGVAVLEMARHKDTEVNVIVSPDDLIETLDEHNIQLQSPRAASCCSFHAIDARRLDQRRRWVVSLSSSRPFGPRSTGDAPRRHGGHGARCRFLPE